MFESTTSLLVLGVYTVHYLCISYLIFIVWVGETSESRVFLLQRQPHGILRFRVEELLQPFIVYFLWRLSLSSREDFKAFEIIDEGRPCLHPQIVLRRFDLLVGVGHTYAAVCDHLRADAIIHERGVL